MRNSLSLAIEIYMYACLNNAGTHTHTHTHVVTVSRTMSFKTLATVQQDQQKNHDLSHSQVYPLLTHLVTASGSLILLLVGDDSFLKNLNNVAIPPNR